MVLHRCSGILLHPTSLPGKYGIGDFGEHCFRFIDFLHQAGQSVWHILPLTLTGYGDSPYQSTSTFAGNTLLISLDALEDLGWLKADDLLDAPSFPEQFVDYGPVIEFHNNALDLAYKGFQSNATVQQIEYFESFCKDETDWLDDFALFMALKHRFSGSLWMDWEDGYVQRKPEVLSVARKEHAGLIREYKFRQWVFFMQWNKVVEYAHSNGIQIVGDMPIFVAHDGSDVWSNQHIFQLDEHGHPTVVAGVPPDYFSATGQLWGNPLFNWNALRRQNFDWWVKRVRFMLRIVDYIRVDHFPGFDSTWEIPYGEPTAEHGRYTKVPGNELFNVLEKEIGSLGDFMIAEDLGLITPSVVNLRNTFGIPGMKVLQFAFSNPSDAFLPHNFDTTNCIVYTGTHDNNTVLGWYEQETFDDTKKLFRAYVGHDVMEPHWEMIRMGMQSIAVMSIVPLQDVLGLGVETRMNAPGAMAMNWSWRFIPDQITSDLTNRVRALTELYNRLPS